MKTGKAQGYVPYISLYLLRETRSISPNIRARASRLKSGFVLRSTK